ncbi:carboxy terminal-processing peptidase [Xanthomonadaceae bacterium JHOS43]|nr:carboxy terminal-processing peptidase [Xanthomonadaceae bacterium JHOS43]
MFASRPLIAFALAFAVAGGALAKPAQTSDLVMAPTTTQVDVSTLVTQLLSNSRYHYHPLPLDNALSERIYDRYLEALDRDRMFLLASDVEGFAHLRTSFDDALRERQIQPAFDMFNLYIQRVADRTRFVRDYLKTDIDLTADETWNFDRKDAPFAATSDELDALWRKRVKNDVLRLKLAGKEMDAIRETLDKRYANYESRTRAIRGDDVFQTFMNAYTSAIEPHTSYMNPRTTENFAMSMRLSLEGIGAVLQINDEEVTVIRSIVPGGPAGMSGEVKPGDRIYAVGQGKDGPMLDVVGWRLDDVVEKIRGPRGTEVRLDILPADAGPDGEHKLVLLTREKVKLEEQAAKKSVIEIGEGENGHRIGLIELPTFYQDFDGRRRDEPDYRSATRDVARLLEELKQEKVDGIVIDLRNNGGGSLTEAVELTGLFIDKGPVVQVRDARGRLDVQRDTAPGTTWDGPLAVMVNRASASASEIFAGAIQDYGRGLVIGEPTFGKGTVQNLVDLDMFVRGDDPGFGQLKVTIAQFFRIEGGSTQHRGITPDIAFPVTLDADDYGESIYENALPWTRVDAADYVAQANFKPLLPLLETRHETRTKADQEFIWWAEDVAEYRRQRAEKSVSLNEATRRAERERNEARRKAREEIRKANGLASTDPADSDDGLQADERDVVADAAREEEDKEQSPDVLAREAAHILADAIDLLNADRALAAQVLPARADTPAEGIQ